MSNIIKISSMAWLESILRNDLGIIFNEVLYISQKIPYISEKM